MRLVTTSVSVTIENGRLKTDQPAKLEKTGKKIIVKGQNSCFGNFCTYKNGNVSIGCIGNVSGVGNVITSGSGTMYTNVSRSGTFVNTNGNDVYINGVRIDPKLYGGQEIKKDKEDQDYKILDVELSENEKFDEVEISGSADVILYSNVAATLNITISGSGSVYMNSTLMQNAVFNITGSGKIKCVDCEVVSFVAQISGSGCIKGVYISGTGVLCLTGSGDISVKAKNPKMVTKSNMGSGRISVKTN